MDVSLRRVGVIVAAGIAIGGILVGGLAAAAMDVRGQASPIAVVDNASIAPITPTADPTRSVVSAPVGPSSGALAALSSTAVVNGRLAVDAGTLATTLARSGATTIEIARALRSLAADAALGVDLTGRLRPWAAAAPTMTQLDDFYQSMARTARLALRAPLSDDRSYRRAAAEMMALLRSLGAVDAASRTLAASVGMELPPVTLSNTTDAP